MAAAPAGAHARGLAGLWGRPGQVSLLLKGEPCSATASYTERHGLKGESEPTAIASEWRSTGAAQAQRRTSKTSGGYLDEALSEHQRLRAAPAALSGYELDIPPYGREINSQE